MPDTQTKIKLADLGERICIIGPSSSGKSTLAANLAVKLNVPVFHLDQYRYLPNTNWALRDDDEFQAMHEAAVAQNGWVIEGNYSSCMPKRFVAATAVIWLDPPLLGCVYRYICRCLKGNGNRAGNLEGATEQFNPELIRYILFGYPKKKPTYQKLLKDFHGHMVLIKSMNELNAYYKQWGLK